MDIEVWGGRTTALDCRPTHIGIPAEPVGMTEMGLFWSTFIPMPVILGRKTLPEIVTRRHPEGVISRIGQTPKCSS